MNFEYAVASVSAVVSAAVLAYVFVKLLLSIRSENDAATTSGGTRALLALPGAFVQRRRVNDRELNRKLDELDKLRVQAGGRFLEGATSAEIFAARFVFPAIALAFFFIMGAILRLPGAFVFLLAIFFAALLYFWPESGLRGAAEARSTQFTKDLPMALDVMRLVCQSGGDLFSAVRTTSQIIGASPVREELLRAIGEVAIGSSLAKALSNVGERVGTSDANAVFSTLAQSLEMGTSVSENLKSASELIRHSQRIKAQAKAQKAVVAMTFPLLLLILPGVFIVLFAPMIIQYSQTH